MLPGLPKNCVSPKYGLRESIPGSPFGPVMDRPGVPGGPGGPGGPGTGIYCTPSLGDGSPGGPGRPSRPSLPRSPFSPFSPLSYFWNKN